MDKLQSQVAKGQSKKAKELLPEVLEAVGQNVSVAYVYRLMQRHEKKRSQTNSAASVAASAAVNAVASAAASASAQINDVPHSTLMNGHDLSAEMNPEQIQSPLHLD